MAKYLFALFLFYFTFYSVDAQKRLNISINAGVAIPTGNFYQKDIFDSASAFAKTGSSIDITLGYRFSSLFGTEILIGGQQNSVDINDASTKLSNIAGTPVQLESGKWKMYKIMIGLDFEKPIDQMNKMFFSSRILAGVSSTSTPSQWTNQTIIQTDGSILGYGSAKNFNAQMPYRFTAQLGIGLNYFVYRGLFIKINLDYSLSHADYYVYPYSIYQGMQLNNVNTPDIPLIAVNGQSPILVERTNNVISTTAGVGVKF